MDKNTERQIDELEFDTLAIRAGHQRSDYQENSEAIFTTSSFVFKSAEEAAARFGAALEEGEACVATASGMSAILATMLGGVAMSPFNAWVFTKGLETLNLRMKAHCDNAMKLAQWLQAQDMVEHVYYPGLTDHPQHELAKKQQTGFGGIVSFIVKGGKENAWKVINGTRLLSITANLGDTKSTITHPATTTHGRLTQELRDETQISDGLLRVSVGLEDVLDIQNDLARGLN
ncbi:O-succinylhomoserine sulfhydrylase [Nymphon striatum]|nr:O-succinylhomoserine sulfhydrylase [Nymphon striatum]